MSDPVKLTNRQREIYEFIAEKIAARGYGPTVREIGSAFEIRSPNGVMCHLQALVKKGLISREPNMSRAISLLHARREETGIPLSGSIAAGLPIETYEQSERIDFGRMLHKEGHFALKVRGQSMIEDHIDEGDFVIVRRQETARDGQTVVALVDGAETTLKRFYREGSRVRLEPRNSSMQPIYSNNVQILGVVVGVVRQMEPVAAVH
ncbi:transcriptional repressor LexA [bacterium]|jgi:repressor LexA|nr:transcriptional repressor LexA [bacterium]